MDFIGYERECMSRWLLIALGWLAVVLATLGVVLPLLPTTPFLLLPRGALLDPLRVFIIGYFTVLGLVAIYARGSNIELCLQGQNGKQYLLPC